MRGHSFRNEDYLLGCGLTPEQRQYKALEPQLRRLVGQRATSPYVALAFRPAFRPGRGLDPFSLHRPWRAMDSVTAVMLSVIPASQLRCRVANGACQRLNLQESRLMLDHCGRVVIDLDADEPQEQRRLVCADLAKRPIQDHYKMIEHEKDPHGMIPDTTIVVPEGIRAGKLRIYRGECWIDLVVGGTPIYRLPVGFAGEIVPEGTVVGVGDTVVTLSGWGWYGEFVLRDGRPCRDHVGPDVILADAKRHLLRLANDMLEQLLLMQLPIDHAARPRPVAIHDWLPPAYVEYDAIEARKLESIEGIIYPGEEGWEGTKALVPYRQGYDLPHGKAWLDFRPSFPFLHHTHGYVLGVPFRHDEGHLAPVQAGDYTISFAPLARLISQVARDEASQDMVEATS